MVHNSQRGVQKLSGKDPRRPPLDSCHGHSWRSASLAALCEKCNRWLVNCLIRAYGGGGRTYMTMSMYRLHIASRKCFYFHRNKKNVLKVEVPYNIETHSTTLHPSVRLILKKLQHSSFKPIPLPPYKNTFKTKYTALLQRNK